MEEILLIYKSSKILVPEPLPLNLINSMFKNYLTIAFRSLLRHKGFSLINILGLAIGMAACLLIMQYVSFELSYDAFHANKDRIYRIPVANYLANGQQNTLSSSNTRHGPNIEAGFCRGSRLCTPLLQSGWSGTNLWEHWFP
jgi:hypothetical protein